MIKRLAISAAVAALAAALWFTVSGRQVEPARPNQTVRGDGAVEPSSSAGSALQADGAASVRRSAESPSELGFVRGRVIDRLGRGVAADVELVCPDGTSRVQSDRDGSFGVAAPCGAATLEVKAAGFLPWRMSLTAAQLTHGIAAVLQRGRTLRGRARADSDWPEHGVELRVLGAGQGPTDGVWKLDRPGAYEIGALSCDALWLHVVGAGLEPAFVHIPEGLDATLDLNLRPGLGAALDVHLSGGDAESVSLTLVGANSAQRLARRIEHRNRPIGGTIRFDGLPPGAYRVDAAPAGARGAGVWAHVELASGEQRTCSLAFGAIVALRGRVVDGRTGAAVAALDLDFTDPRQGRTVSVRSDAQGEFEVDRFRRGTSLRASSGSDEWVLLGGAKWGSVDVAESWSSEALVLSAVAARRIAVNVVAPDDSSEVGVELILHRGTPRGPVLSRTTAHPFAPCEFAVPSGLLGRHALVGRTSTSIGVLEFELEGVGARLPDLVLERTATVFGLVTPQGQRAVEVVHARLLDLESLQSVGWGDRSCTLDAQGAFRFEGLPPGRYAVGADLRGDAGSVLTLAPGTVVGPIELDAERRGAATITGRVVDNLGRSVAGAHVGASAGPQEGGLAEHLSAVTGSDGRFALTLREDRPHRVEARRWSGLGESAEHTLRPSTVQPGDDVLLVLEPSPRSTVRGSVVAPGAVEFVARISGSNAGLVRRAALGAFEFVDAPSGRLRATLEAPGYEPTVFEFETGDGQVHDLGVVELRPLARARIRVVDAAGSPLAGIEVFRLGAEPRFDVPGGLQNSLGRSGRDGMLEPNMLGAAPVHVAAWSPGFAPAATELRVDHADCTLRLVRGVALRIEPLGPALAEAAAWDAQLSRLDDESLTRRRLAHRDLDALEFLDLAPGEYRLELRPLGGGARLAWRAEFVVQAGTDRSLRLEDVGERVACEDIAK